MLPPSPSLSKTAADRAARSSTAEQLRSQVAARLAAHRNRRPLPQDASSAASSRIARAGSHSSRVAAAVAERFAQTPSYREFLAAEAERAIRQARAAAEIAALNARAVADAQQRLLEALAAPSDAPSDAPPHVPLEDHAILPHSAGAPPAAGLIATAAPHHPLQPVAPSLWPELDSPSRAARPRTARAATPAARPASACEPPAALTVRLYHDAVAGFSSPRTTSSSHSHNTPAILDPRAAAEARALDEEIAFRQSPVFEEPAGPPAALAANLIEFPRQLVAARKARPRYAEGPLRDEPTGETIDQLRIFEVDPEQISTEPAQASPDAAQWSSLWLDTAPGAALPGEEAVTRPARVILPAAAARRCLAALINLAIISAALLASATAAGAILARGIKLHSGIRAILASLAARTGLDARLTALLLAAGFAFLMLAYHALCFWFSTGNPGMRCARIAFCTFDDADPTRRAVRRRFFAVLLSTLPLGLGFAWATLDEERLTWHDRLSGMYLRSY